MKIKGAHANNRRKCIEIETVKGVLTLPYEKLNLRPTSKNKIKHIFVDKELASQAITYVLRSDEEDSVHLDAFLDYNRDPDFMRQVLLHKLTADAIKLVKSSRLSKHELMRRLNTSPSQLYRLLDPANYRKSVDEMIRLLTVLGYRLECSVIKDVA